jgi:hypothetical protein
MLQGGFSEHHNQQRFRFKKVWPDLMNSHEIRACDKPVVKYIH